MLVGYSINTNAKNYIWYHFFRKKNWYFYLLISKNQYPYFSNVNLSEENAQGTQSDTPACYPQHILRNFIKHVKTECPAERSITMHCRNLFNLTEETTVLGLKGVVFFPHLVFLFVFHSICSRTIVSFNPFSDIRHARHVWSRLLRGQVLRLAVVGWVERGDYVVLIIVMKISKLFLVIFISRVKPNSSSVTLRYLLIRICCNLLFLVCWHWEHWWF